MCAVMLGVAWFFVAGATEVQHRPGAFIVEFTGLLMFMLIFIVQRNNNKDLKAMHLKLDELIATKEGASNRLIKAEETSEAEIEKLHKAYTQLAKDLEHPTKAISIDPNHFEDQLETL